MKDDQENEKIGWFYRLVCLSWGWMDWVSELKQQKELRVSFFNSIRSLMAYDDDDDERWWWWWNGQMSKKHKKEKIWRYWRNEWMNEQSFVINMIKRILLASAAFSQFAQLLKLFEKLSNFSILFPSLPPSIFIASCHFASSNFQSDHWNFLYIRLGYYWPCCSLLNYVCWVSEFIRKDFCCMFSFSPLASGD